MPFLHNDRKQTGSGGNSPRPRTEVLLETGVSIVVSAEGL
jgi:hypothetical protein